MKHSYRISFQIPLILFAILVACFWQINGHKNLVLEPSIEWEVKEVLAQADSSGSRNYYWPDQYPNLLYFMVKQNDTVVFDSFTDSLTRPFSACWGVNADTITIKGAFGENPNGFEVEIIKKQAKAYYLNSFLRHDELISRTPQGPLASASITECKKLSITLDDMPYIENTDTIFGLLEFETGAFYWLAEPKLEDSPREKIEVKMKCYFKAVHCEE